MLKCTLCGSTETIVQGISRQAFCKDSVACKKRVRFIKAAPYPAFTNKLKQGTVRSESTTYLIQFGKEIREYPSYLPNTLQYPLIYAFLGGKERGFTIGIDGVADQSMDGFAAIDQRILQACKEVISQEQPKSVAKLMASIKPPFGQ